MNGVNVISHDDGVNIVNAIKRMTDVIGKGQQKAGNDDALALHLCLERRLHLLHSLPDGQGSPARVERMLYESALCIEVVGG